MSWWTPRTWVDGETETADIMNKQVRDNLVILGAYITPDGVPKLSPAKSFAWGGSAIAGVNACSGSAETHLTGPDITVAADTLTQPGDQLAFAGLFYNSTAVACAYKFQISGGTKVTLVTAPAVASQPIPFRFAVEYRTSTTGYAAGFMWDGVAAGGAPTYVTVAAAITGLDWTASQVAQWYIDGNASNDGFLTELNMYTLRAKTGDSTLV